MNKIAKGAIATGVGIILLAGGGGTLAVWNQSANSTLGSVASGDLNMTATNGKWTNAAAPLDTIDIATYRVVPGDVLTYTQDVNVTLVGDLMKANLTLTGAAVDGITVGSTTTRAFGGAATVSPLTLTKGTAVLPDTILDESDTGVVKASTTFTFDSTTSGRTATDAIINLSGIGYALTQVAP